MDWCLTPAAPRIDAAPRSHRNSAGCGAQIKFAACGHHPCLRKSVPLRSSISIRALSRTLLPLRRLGSAARSPTAYPRVLPATLESPNRENVCPCRRVLLPPPARPCLPSDRRLTFPRRLHRSGSPRSRDRCPGSHRVRRMRRFLLPSRLLRRSRAVCRAPPARTRRRRTRAPTRSAARRAHRSEARRFRPAMTRTRSLTRRLTRNTTRPTR